MIYDSSKAQIGDRIVISKIRNDMKHLNINSELPKWHCIIYDLYPKGWTDCIQATILDRPEIGSTTILISKFRNETEIQIDTEYYRNLKLEQIGI